MPAFSKRASERRAEYLLAELLEVQGWNLQRPPKGELLLQQEYRSYPNLNEILERASKKGMKHGIPEGILVDRENLIALAVIETKTDVNDLDVAISEATAYGFHFINAGHNILAVGLAGTSEDDFAVHVMKWSGTKWDAVTYDGEPINWIPNIIDLERVIAQKGSELRPTPPHPDVLAKHADEINRLLRESHIKDEFRPAVIGAIMLALWSSKGNIRKDKDNILNDVNSACEKAFWHAKRPDLGKSLRVDEANGKLAVKARRIVTILERLNVPVLTAENDYLGQLYETFFRYTGGNTIGQYFTPRHITSFMADLCEVGPKDFVLDPACGTGGFLVSAMHRIAKVGKLSRTQTVNLIKERLWGIEEEPVTAALCVANMILRGDGSTGIFRDDCFSSKDFPNGKATVVLMNPPFPHRNTDTPPEDFIDRALEGLDHSGRLATIVPGSLLVKNTAWRKKILNNNTLECVITLPNELFQPYSSSTTAILLMRKGIPHNSKTAFFARIENDGFMLRKRVRIEKEGSQLRRILLAYQNKDTIPNFCGKSKIIKDEWHPGAYVPPKELSPEEILSEIDNIIRSKLSMFIKHAPQLFKTQTLVDDEEITCEDFRKYTSKKFEQTNQGTLGYSFDIYYGLKELENTSSLVPGPCPIITSSGANNGLYGFYFFEKLIRPPLITVPRTGSIGEAHVQEWPCGVNNNCLVLLPRENIAREKLFVAAAVLRSEQWRFNYGRVLTPKRAAAFHLPEDKVLLEKVKKMLDQTDTIEKVIHDQTKSSYN